MIYKKNMFNIAVSALVPLAAFSLSPMVVGEGDSEAKVVVDSKDVKHPFESEFRKAMSYRAVEPVQELAKRLKMSGYDVYENPTGIYFRDGEKIKVKVDGNPSTQVKLYVTDFGTGRKSFDSYDLKPGENEITIEKQGLGYIHYEASDYLNAPDIKVGIEGGVVNGVFKAGDDNAKWKTLLANAKAEFIDLYGERVHVAFPVEMLKKYTANDGVELLAFYDKMMEVEQKIIGFGYKSERPRNHIFGRAVHRGYMFADGLGAGFNVKEETIRGIISMESLMNPANITFGFWGVTHEFGHVNQTRPGFKWLGMTEVTNNLMAMACCYEINKPILRLERENVNDGTSKLPGGYYNLYTKNGLIDGEKWQMQSQSQTGHSSVDGGNVFVRLIPMWQLYLYTAIAGQGNRNFYPEFHLWLRENDAAGLSDGQHQLNFIQQACRINKLDLTGFFEATGMLKPIDVELKDYRKGHLKITEEDCAKIKEFAAQYPKPETPLIQYINANNIECYKEKSPLAGPDIPGRGVEYKDGACTISQDIWKNAVAFETYNGSKITSIALSGTGAPKYGDKVTVAYFPEGSTEIKAVGWNGQKKTVYKK